ncbi:MAG TPA: hypothetical protein VME01_09720, partial [Solirubrobacteraceae bacterium]|nr:hypothetical protein [Solirubrobacteraceae bacterium]
PSGYRLTGDQVLAIARRNPTVIAELKKHPHLVGYVYTRSAGWWQVSYFTPPAPAGTKHPKPQIEMLQLYVSDQTGAVTQVWTGYQVAWTMARGYPGAFGKTINKLYVWIPLCVAFFLPFFPWRRRPTLWHLDLLMLLGFSISLAFFNNANIGMSAPSIYPFMVYLLVRLLLLASGRGRPREPLRLVIPTSWLAIALIFLVGFRIGLNVTNSNVIDVGYAGVIGADKIVHGQKLYGNWPADNPAGDTYGPVNYAAYVPFYEIFGWSGVWDNLPAAHAAAITFDLLTMLGLFVLGWTIRGPTAGTVLAYLWAAFPFTTFVLSSNSNDALVAFMIVLSLLLIRWAWARGLVGGLAGLTKFAPLGLAPLLMRGIGDPPPRRSIVRFAVMYAIGVFGPIVPVILSHDFHYFWNDAISYQANRPAPFSIWGLWGGYTQSLKIPERCVLGLTVLLGVAAGFWPRGRRTMVEVAALGGAIIIGLQCSITYWFYLYIVWFFPLVIIALVLAHPASDGDRATDQLSAKWSEPAVTPSPVSP